MRSRTRLPIAGNLRHASANQHLFLLVDADLLLTSMGSVAFQIEVNVTDARPSTQPDLAVPILVLVRQQMWQLFPRFEWQWKMDVPEESVEG